jgi:hypothetical protein
MKKFRSLDGRGWTDKEHHAFPDLLLKTGVKLKL